MYLIENKDHTSEKIYKPLTVFFFCNWATAATAIPGLSPVVQLLGLHMYHIYYFQIWMYQLLN